MKRRHFLTLAGAAVAGAIGYRYWPDEGIWNPCLAERLPPELAGHALVRAAWEGIDPREVWDCHVHLIGAGQSDTGTWISPKMESLRHPVEFAQKRFYLNAGCAENAADIDGAYVTRLLSLLENFPPGVRVMLLAFDYHHTEAGERVLDRSSFHTPNEYAARLAQRHPDRFEWIASVHPYRRDCVEALEWAVAHGARAVKWLPPAMGMNPASPLCDRFYEAMTRLRIPLLTHAGEEAAVEGGEAQALGNPLLLRRPLERGVTVIVAHCASLGTNRDLDLGANGPATENFNLFARLLEEPRYIGKLFGDISAMTQVNRLGAPIETLLQRPAWHGRLLNGSDYPLPAVMPLFSMTNMVARGYITDAQAQVLSAIRRYNPLLFDFLLKRTLSFGNNRFSADAFHTRRHFGGKRKRSTRAVGAAAAK